MSVFSWVSLAVGIIGAIIGITGWLSGRDKKTSADGEWRGVVNTKLDTIGTSILAVSSDIKCVQNTLNDHGKILANHETRLTQAEQRISKRKIQTAE
jgi:hypothetical protein